MGTAVVNAVLPCSNVKFAYTAKGFDDDDVPPAAISGKIILCFVLSFIFTDLLIIINILTVISKIVS